MVVKNSIHTCTEGHSLWETDHKPLKMISLKNLTVAPAWLQRMLLHPQQYDLIIMYRPGKEMLLADALSCLLSRTNTEIKLDLRVDAISTFRILPKTSHQDSSRDAMGPHPLDSALTHPEWLAWQTRSCPPEWPDSTGASETSSPLMATSSPRVNEWSFHHLAETV